MSDQSKPMYQKLYESLPSSRQTVKFLTASTIGTALFVLSGLTLAGTVIALVIVTPLLVLFSPLLVPAGAVIFVVTAGFFFSGGCGLAAVMSLLWMYNYVTGKHPPGADKLDYARGMLAEKAKDMKQKVKEYGQYVRHKA